MLVGHTLLDTGVRMHTWTLLLRKTRIPSPEVTEEPVTDSSMRTYLSGGGFMHSLSGGVMKMSQKYLGQRRAAYQIPYY